MNANLFVRFKFPSTFSSGGKIRPPFFFFFSEFLNSSSSSSRRRTSEKEKSSRTAKGQKLQVSLQNKKEKNKITETENLLTAMDDDEWNLSTEELDSLEKNAFRQLADRRKCEAAAASSPAGKCSFASASAPSSSCSSGGVLPPMLHTSPFKRISVKLSYDAAGNRIAVEFPYHKELISFIKSIPGYEWDHNQRVWKFPENQLLIIGSTLNSLRNIVDNVYAVPPLCLPAVLGNQGQSGYSSAKGSPANSQPTNYESCRFSPFKLFETSPVHGGSPVGQKNNITVQIYEISQERIAARSIYHEKIKEACQSVPGRLWSTEQKVWTFPKIMLDALLDSLDKIFSVGISVKALPPVVLPESWVGHFDRKKALESESSSGTSRVAKQLFQIDSNDPVQIDSMQNVLKSDGLVKFHVRIFLHGSGRLATKFDYQSEIVAFFRALPKSEWLAKERLWTFPISALTDVEKGLKQVTGVSVAVDSVDQFVRCALQSAAALPNLLDMYGKMPDFLESELLPFQREGVRFSLEHGGRVLIADEMGLGKTLQGIAIAACLQEAWPVLVIVPSALRLHWAMTIQKWLKLDPSSIVVVMSQWGGSYRGGFNIVQASGRQAVQLDGLFNIVSYDLVTKIQDTLTNSDFNIVITDESHYLKNAQAKRTNACVPLLQKAKHCILLTGTPALSRPIELFKQLEALHPYVYKDVHVYGKRYCRGGIFGFYQGASNHEELHALLKSTVLIRRLKKDVLSELPVKRREQIFLSLEEKGLRQMKALFHELEGIKKQIKICTSEEEVQTLKLSEKQLINKIYNDSADVKIPAVLDYLGTVVEAGCKFLVFAHHLSMLDAIEQFASKKKVGYIRIDGKTPLASRHTFVNQFQERDDIKMAVLGIKAAGVGITLTAASTVIFAELSWTPGDVVQAEDRVHRIGQVSSVNVSYLHANDTIDDIIWDAIQHKLENIGQVLDGQQDALEAASSKHYNLGRGQRKLTTMLQPCMGKLSLTSSTDTAGQVTDGQRDALEAASSKHYNLGRGKRKLTTMLQPCMGKLPLTSSTDTAGQGDEESTEHHAAKKLKITD